MPAPTPADDPRLTAYVLGELDPAERAEVEALLRNDPAARREADALRATAATLRAALAAEPCPSLSEEDRKMITDAAERPRRLLLVIATRYMPIAACLAALLALGIGILLPPLGAARRSSRQLQALTEARGRLQEAFLQGRISEEEYLRTESNLMADGRVDLFARDYAYGLSGPQTDGDVLGPTRYTPPTDREAYDRIVDNPFLAAIDNPLSTFSVDVDTASYSNVRRFLASGQLPPPDAVRIEELVNYFDYDYAPPATIVQSPKRERGSAGERTTGAESSLADASGSDAEAPFAAHVEVAAAPWNPGHRLVRIGLKGYEVDAGERGPANLVFLLDVSGSMNSPDKLPLVKEGMKRLVGELRGDDRVAIVVYAGASGLALESTPVAERQTILDAIDALRPGGSTNGAAGIELAYQQAREHFVENGVNRVILCTDGDFNVGVTDRGQLTRLIEEKAESGVYLSVLGFGAGNLNDAMMEELSNKGDGNYAYIDSVREAERVLVEQAGSTLVAIAKDVKVQVEFNPAKVAAYRLIGYENRVLAKEDFNDDTKDAGDIGSGHTVTALYEVVPQEAAPLQRPRPELDPLKYQRPSQLTDAARESDELLTLKLRYKAPDAPKERGTSELIAFPVADSNKPWAEASADFKFAAAVASFGMLLRDSPYRGDATFDAVLELAQEGITADNDPRGDRAEFVELVRKAKALASAEPAE